MKDDGELIGEAIYWSCDDLVPADVRSLLHDMAHRLEVLTRDTPSDGAIYAAHSRSLNGALNEPSA